MMSKLCVALLVAVAVVESARIKRQSPATFPCDDGMEEERCPDNGWCNDIVCSFKDRKSTLQVIPPRSVSVPGQAKNVQCKCKQVGNVRYVRQYLNGKCIPGCTPTPPPPREAVSVNSVQSVDYETPQGPYTLPGGQPLAPPPPPPQAAVVAATTEDPILKKYLKGHISHTDDTVEKQRDTMLANGMTVEQLAVLKPFYRLYSEGTADHFYTWVHSQIDSSINDFGYKMEGISGKVATAPADITGQGIPCDRLKPLNQFFKGGILADPDHFYTTKQADEQRAVAEGYAKEGIAAYCVEFSPGCGATIPLHRFWNEPARDHIYVTGYKDFNALTADAGWSYEGVECYIWPAI